MIKNIIMIILAVYMTGLVGSGIPLDFDKKLFVYSLLSINFFLLVEAHTEKKGTLSLILYYAMFLWLLYVVIVYRWIGYDNAIAYCDSWITDK